MVQILARPQANAGGFSWLLAAQLQELLLVQQVVVFGSFWLEASLPLQDFRNYFCLAAFAPTNRDTLPIAPKDSCTLHKK